MKRRDIEDLVATGMPDGLLPQKQQARVSPALRTHTRMLAVLRTAPGKRGRGGTRARDVHQPPLIRELNALAMSLTQAALRSLGALSSTQCAFACDLEDHGGGTYRWRSTFDQVPMCSDQLTMLRFTDALAVLSVRQQADVVRLLSLEQDLELAQIHLDFARKDERADAIPDLQKDVVKLTSSLGGLRRSLSRVACAWLLKNHSLISSLQSTTCIAPKALSVSADATDLLEFASWYEALGKRMCMPLPLDDKSEPVELAKWRKHWASFEEYGKGVLVLACWARALGSIDVYNRCELCFRHRGDELRHHCEVHKRTALKRIPRREEHIAREYKNVLSVAPTPSAEVNPFANLLTELPAPGMVRAAKQLCLPEELIAPALGLGSYLRCLYPLLNFRQRRLIATQFKLLLLECLVPFRINHFETADERIKNIVHRREATQRVTWHRLFRLVFGSVAGREIAVGAGRGQVIDRTHPLVSTVAFISDRKLIDDLHRFRVWIDVDFAIDKLVYLDDATVLEEFWRQQQELGRKPTLRELETKLNASPETIRKALLRATGDKSTQPPKRRHSRRGRAPDT